MDAREITSGAATRPGHAAELPPSPFIGLSAAQVADGAAWRPEERVLLVLDERSAEDYTALLVTTETEDGPGLLTPWPIVIGVIQA
ncbi:b81f6a15-bdbc-4816-9183-1466a2078dec [Thermothielavioides terrestris]|uniref:B81f6a15-bdbc-4816-9183-1466a2078dec n=1 Tax=Thermothielavioides terrestris TaxID=2587410 RepID=A0A3S4B9I0_9PEZI|nr:b81f6a15-bdbc-4816-9183-1466a2078dec [Thermothielavioides terrestris]